MGIWYMHDNHAFRKLPRDIEEAMAIVKRDFDEGEKHGMLCTHSGPRGLKNEHAHGDWIEFEPRARKWLEAAMSPTAEELEYASWFAAPSQGEGEG